MNRLEEGRIRTIGSSFYKNVSLLTQMQAPFIEFQRYFRQGMFDKPNTAGFLHVSHYLSIVYDATLFKQIVRWPISCKKDEVTYRIDMRNFLSILSHDNPDVNFPSILMSHLIQSGGTKFLIIMWKLSQVALRTYIKREFQGELWNAPCPSPMDHLTVTYFNNVIAKKHSIIIETYKEIQRIHDTAIIFLNNEIEILNVYKSEIFDRKENIERLVVYTPVHPLIQKRLIDVEDINVINLWKKNILEKMQYIRRKNKELNELEESCDCLCKLVLRISTNSGPILDANKFPKINYNNFLLEQKFSNTINNLHVDSSINSLSTLLTLLYLISVQMLYHINAADFSDLSPCLLFIQNICKEIQFLQMLLMSLNTRINYIFRNEQCVCVCNSQENENAYANSDISKLLLTNYKVLMQSPKINLNFNKCVDDNLFYEKLCSSLTEKGKHKELFKRYTSSHKLSATLSDVSSSWNNMNGWLSPRALSTKYKQLLLNGKELSPFSRLLHRSKLNLKRFRENVSCSLSASYEGLNLTTRNHHSKHITMQKYDGRKRDFFNSIATSSLSYVSSDSEN